MAVLGRVLFSSAERVDLPDLLSIDSYAAGDWRYFLQTMVGATRPYILTGFDVISPANAIGVPTCSIRVADSIVYFPGSSAGPFFYGLPEGNANSEPLSPSLRLNAVNYVYLTLTTFDTASDTRAFWAPDRNGGEGGEFTQDVNTESVIQAQVNVSTGSFPTNTVPLAIITTSSTGITSIQDARDLLFRLGTGGLNPNPLNSFTFPSTPTAGHARLEPDTTISAGSDPNPFQGGDKNITTLKEWMDVVMTKIKELGGTQYWYQDTESLSMMNLFHDSLTTAWKSKGSYTHSSANPGDLTWSEDLYIKSMSSPKDIVIRAAAATPISLGNEQVAFLDMVRNEPINSLDLPVAFTAGQTYINTVGGSVGLFANLRKGDWIKKAHDPDHMFLQVREFYNTTQSPGAGLPDPTTNPYSGTPVMTPANARSITLSGVYAGTTSQATGDRARYDQGEYLSTDIQIVDRSNSLITDAAGDYLWFAQRSDTVQKIAAVGGFEITGNVTAFDGVTAMIETAIPYGLQDGYRIMFTSSPLSGYAFTVQAVDDYHFTISTGGAVLGPITATFAMAQTVATIVDGFQMESDTHGFESGETITIDGTVDYNGSYVIAVVDNTTFQFAGPYTGLASETVGTATLARLDVRSEEGITKIVQGETIDVGASDTDNIRSFIGMSAPAQTHPDYAVSDGIQDMINGGVEYRGYPNDSLTTRVSKINALVADKAQDKMFKFATTATSVLHADNAGARDIWFSPPASTLTVVQPASPYNAVITLPAASGVLSLQLNEVAYISINRNEPAFPAIQVADVTYANLLGENIFVIAARTDTDDIVLWNGNVIPAATYGGSSAPINPVDPAFVVVSFYDPVSLTLPIGSVTVDNTSVEAGQTVLFNALNGAPDSPGVYEAVGIGAAISDWELLYSFHGLQFPIEGDQVVVRSGASFNSQIGSYLSGNWEFNSAVRYFNGADFVEQSNMVTATINDNTTATLFSVAYAGSEHMVIDYSIMRSATWETGTMHVVTNGITASVTTNSAYVSGDAGVTFSANVSGANVIVAYTSTNTGSSGTMKYMVKRWSASAGGPTGLPSYSGAAAPPTAAATPVEAIQFNVGGNLAANANFKIDTEDLSVNYNGLRQGVLSSGITLLNNQTSWANLFTMDATDYPFIVLEYSVVKEGHYRTGSILVASNGTLVSTTESSTETGVTGFSIQAIISGSNIQFQYQTTNLTGDGTFKYSWRKWV